MKNIIKSLIIFIIILILFRPNLNALNQKTKYVDNIKHIYQEAKVIKVIDGDTIIVKINKKKYKVRFVLINCPEMSDSNPHKRKLAKDAKKFTKKSLYHKIIYLEKDVSNTDKYDRLLRYVWIKKPSHPLTKDDLYKYCFNSILLKEGYAKLSKYPPDIYYIDFFKNVTKKNISKLDNNKPDIKDNVKDNIIKGNKRSKIYHLKGQMGYNKINKKNLVFFKSESEAKANGYRKAKK